MFERVDKVTDRFEARLNLFEKRIKRALRIRMLFIFGSCVTFAFLMNVFIYFHG